MKTCDGVRNVYYLCGFLPVLFTLEQNDHNQGFRIFNKKQKILNVLITSLTGSFDSRRSILMLKKMFFSKGKVLRHPFVVTYTYLLLADAMLQSKFHLQLKVPPDVLH